MQDVATRLERSKRLEQAAAARDAVLEQLLDSAEIPLPEGVVAEELAGRRQEIEQQLAYAGTSMEQYLDNEKQTIDEFEAELEKRVRDAMASQFLLDEIAKAEEIGVEQEELSEHLFRRAQQSGQNPDEFVKHMVEHNHIPEMVAEVVRGKALAKIVEGATVTDESGNPVELKNLRPDGSIGDPEAEAQAAAEARAAAEAAEAERVEESAETTPELTFSACSVDHVGELSEHLCTVTANDATVLDAAALAADYAEDLIVGTVRDVHGAVAGRVHGVGDFIGGGPRCPTACTTASPRSSSPGSAQASRPRPRACAPPAAAGVAPRIDETARGRFVVAAVNGLIGDRLRDEGSNLAFDMGVRVGGRDISLDRDGVAAAFPRATDKVVVFVHGLSENEAYWNRAARPKREIPMRRSYGDRLEDEGWTPVYVRVNTGYPIAENGVAMAALLDRLVRSWPVGVRRIALVGHSMGGLILRAACAVTTDSESPWTDLVTDVVCLGTPHLGAPLERVVDKGVRALGALPESAPFGRILEYRSTGILDLRHGLASDVQNLPNARYRLVGATLTRSQRSITSATIGDYLVPVRLGDGPATPRGGDVPGGRDAARPEC